MKKLMGVALFALIGLICVAADSAASSGTLRLDPAAAQQFATSEFLYSPAHLTLDTITQQPASAWRVLESSTLTPPIGEQAWIRFTVSNEDAQAHQWWVVIGWPVLEHLQMHVVSPEGETRWVSRPVGESYPMEQRHLRHRHFLFPLTLDAGETVTVYLEVHSRRLGVMPVEIWNYEAFVEADEKHLFILGAVFGSLAIMFFYNLSLYSILKERVYLYYCVYIAAIFAHLLVVSGLGVYYLWDDWLWLKERAMAIFASASFFAASLFIRHFLSLKAHKGWVLTVNSFFLLLWGGLLALAFVVRAEDTYMLMMSLGSFAGLVASTATACYLWWWRKSTAAKIFVLAWSALNLGTCVFVLMLQGVLPVNNLTRYSQMAGMVIEMAILSFALAYRINEAKLASEKANQEALRLSRQMSEERAERLRAQIAALEVHKKLNEELEVRVRQRTEQLNETLSKLELANKELKELSATDPLTGVHNRRYLDDTLDVECKRANRSGQFLALILLDIDHFKPINDRYGHAVGDKCLRAVAEALKQVVKRPGDLLARYGGEEFVFVLPNTDEAQALKVAEKCRLAVASLKIEHQNQVLSLTISAGVSATIPAGEKAAEFLLREADRALYKAKDEGRNRIVAASRLVANLLG